MSERTVMGQPEAFRKLGRRVWLRWNLILERAEASGLTEEQVRKFVNGGGLFADDATRRTLAASLGFDWEAAADFFAEIAPIIIEMFAACG